MPRKKKILESFKQMEADEKANADEKTDAGEKADPPPKAKRGRKKKVTLESDAVVEESKVEEVRVPKKRGRKPKVKEGLKGQDDRAVTEPVKTLKKRGRKPKEKYGIVTGSVPDIAGEEENVILHLPINTALLEQETVFGEKDILEYNPVIAEPAAYSENSNFQSPFETLDAIRENKKGSVEDDSINTEIKEKIEETVANSANLQPMATNTGENVDDSTYPKEELHYNADLRQPVDGNTIKTIGGVHEQFTGKKMPIKEGNHLLGKQQTFSTLPTFKETNRKREIPKRTSIYCWWCCHSFDNEPCVLPTGLIGEEYQVRGCFCCPECAAAYNHECYRQHQEREHYSLLNTLYKRYYKSEQIPIKLAPPKMCLRIFGGNLSIEEFRENCSNYYQDFTVIQPPMVSIIPQIEENQANVVLKQQRFIPLDKNRIEKATEDLRLQRNKPLAESVNTLENCMKLSYQRED